MTLTDAPRMLLRAPWRLIRLPYTLVEEMRLKEVGDEIPDARLAFLEEMTGRVKATVGFVFGDERLLAAGQVERARAAERLRAVAQEAQAETIEEEADDEFTERANRARRQKTQASVEHAARTRRIARETAAERRRAEADADRARNAVRRQAAEQRQMIDATDEAIRRDTAERLVTADLEEVAAEDAKGRAEEIESARRANT